jgi:hypothetical protein
MLHSHLAIQQRRLQFKPPKLSVAVAISLSGASRSELATCSATLEPPCASDIIITVFVT